MTDFERIKILTGESSRTGAGESYNFDNAPKRIYDVLNRYRLARVGGVTYEAEKE